MKKQVEHAVTAMASKWAREMTHPNPFRQGTPPKRRGKGRWNRPVLNHRS